MRQVFGTALRLTPFFHLLPEGGTGKLTLQNGAKVLLLCCVEPGLHGILDYSKIRRAVRKSCNGVRMRLLHDHVTDPGIVPVCAHDNTERERLMNTLELLVEKHGTEKVVLMEHTDCAGRAHLVGRDLKGTEEADHIHHASYTLGAAILEKFGQRVGIHHQVAVLNGRHDEFRGIQAVMPLEKFMLWDRQGRPDPFGVHLAKMARRRWFGS